jgi:hypothetical protein
MFLSWSATLSANLVPPIIPSNCPYTSQTVTPYLQIVSAFVALHFPSAGYSKALKRFDGFIPIMSTYMERIYPEIYFFNADIFATPYTRILGKLICAYLDKHYTPFMYS